MRPPSLILLSTLILFSGCSKKVEPAPPVPEAAATEESIRPVPTEANVGVQAKGVPGLADRVNRKKTDPEKIEARRVAIVKLREKLAANPESTTFLSDLLSLAIQESNYRVSMEIREPWIEAVPICWYILSEPKATKTNRLIAIRHLASHYVTYNNYPVSEPLAKRIVAELDKLERPSSQDSVNRAWYLAIYDAPAAVTELEKFVKDPDSIARVYAYIRLKALKEKQAIQAPAAEPATDPNVSN